MNSSKLYQIVFQETEEPQKWESISYRSINLLEYPRLLLTINSVTRLQSEVGGVEKMINGVNPLSEG